MYEYHFNFLNSYAKPESKHAMIINQSHWLIITSSAVAMEMSSLASRNLAGASSCSSALMEAAHFCVFSKYLCHLLPFITEDCMNLL